MGHLEEQRFKGNTPGAQFIVVSCDDTMTVDIAHTLNGRGEESMSLGPSLGNTSR